MKNRISSVTRWPMDPGQAIERAQRDLDFADAMFDLGIYHDDLVRISARAVRIFSQARECIKSRAANGQANWRPKKPR